MGNFLGKRERFFTQTEQVLKERCYHNVPGDEPLILQLPMNMQCYLM
jgi:hypothetical protein